MKNVSIPKSEYAQIYKQKRFDAGLCVNCGGQKDTTNRLCILCLDKQSKRLKEKKQARRAQGLCHRCGKSALGHSLYCHDCFFYNVTLNNVKMSQVIAALFVEQNGRCAYTDETLILGVNASTDHKTPQCRGGGHEIDNLQWVTNRINKNKFNLTHEEYVTECAKIAAKFA